MRYNKQIEEVYEQIHMKKCRFVTILVLLCIMSSACGTAEKEEATWQGVTPSMEDLSAITDRTEYYDLFVESEELFQFGLLEKNPSDQSPGDALAVGKTVYVLLGTQFHQGEPIQLWAEARPEDSDIYLYRKDGSSELLLQGISTQYTDPRNRYQWCMDQEGSFYCYHNANYSYEDPDAVRNKENGSFQKILPTGEIQYEIPFDASLYVEDVCLLEESSPYVLLQDKAGDLRKVVSIDPDAGQFVLDDRLQMEMTVETPWLGTAGDSLALVEPGPAGTGRKVVKWNLADGGRSQILSFTGTSYAPHSDLKLQDFRVLEDGGVEFLWTGFQEPEGLLERLRMDRVEKVPVVMRGDFGTDSWITERVAWFNLKSDTYHVILEDCGSGNDAEDFARLTSIQVAAGKGPDILCGDGLLQDYIVGMLEKGALEELNPYMEGSGIREEDYFPATFATWRVGERIYGINSRLNVVGIRMDEGVLGSREVPDIGTLVDALLAQEGDGVFLWKDDSGRLLNLFLRGSDSVWGMVDWEGGTCDFDTPLFAKLLEAARRFGDDGRKQPESSIAEDRWYYDVFEYDSLAEQESEGKVSCGFLFDDGCYGASTAWYTMAINANAAHKEGAWEFLCFLLGEESQGAGDNRPVNRALFDVWMQDDIERKTIAYDRYGTPIITIGGYTKEDATEEKQAEYREAMEEARPFPIRTVPILNIILEEAAEYFGGAKSVEEVSRVVTNRVQLYLDERK